ncbi:hypothetical protein POVWA2_014090 [Plasmodium ovale wallikeri]|uniref:Uncharacterized protein n=1 Tax=Plasmodium ovale wallikeri TaxID=864142 RepID=A0A1A8YNY3_PLAOA|nr:hypothetical protein POVWA1_014240 [Plasmodium ovale wallikeri]SBT33303.1 hypothetical protein POVWA2_014090 [Plasmodium ovale wallikeri]
MVGEEGKGGEECYISPTFPLPGVKQISYQTVYLPICDYFFPVLKEKSRLSSGRSIEKKKKKKICNMVHARMLLPSPTICSHFDRTEVSNISTFSPPNAVCHDVHYYTVEYPFNANNSCAIVEGTVVKITESIFQNFATSRGWLILKRAQTTSNLLIASISCEQLFASTMTHGDAR